MMKKSLLALVLILALLLTGCAASKPAPTATPEPTPTPTPTPTPIPTPTPKPVSAQVQALQGKNEAVWLEMHQNDWMAGRLYIPSAGIDVPLYVWGNDFTTETDEEKVTEYIRQLVVDRENSALIYNDGIGNIIADHSNQEFSKLSNVKLGDEAYILAGKTVTSLRCDLVAEGTNTGNGITDADGNWYSANEDYFCYTCLDDWTHVLVVGFEMVDEDTFDLAEPVLTSPEPTATAVPTATPTPSPAPTETPAPAAAYNPPVYYDYPTYSDDIYSDNYQGPGGSY